MAWFARLFGKTVDDPTHSSSRVQSNAFEAMSLEDIVRVTTSPSTRSFGDAINLYERLLTIAYAQSSTSEQHETALRLADALVASIETGLSDNPEVLRKVRMLRDIAVLHAKMDSVPSERMPEILIAKDNTQLLSTYIHSIGTDQWALFRPGMIRELVISRRSRKGDNPLFVLYWLLHTRDRTAWQVLSAEERRAFSRADAAYEDARVVLVQLGLLPSVSTALPYTPLPERATLKTFLLQTVRDENLPVGVTGEVIEREGGGYGEEFVYGVKLLRFAFLQALALRLTQGIYGREFSDELRAEFKAVFLTNPEQIAVIFDAIDEAFSISERDDSALGVVHAVLAPFFAVVMSGSDESVRGSAFQLTAKWLEEDLYVFPSYWRYLMRYSIHGKDKSAGCMFEDNYLAGE